MVRTVEYDEARSKFRVAVKDLASDVVMPAQDFDYVVNAAGHFSVPHVPDFVGFESFPGHILHAHDFRNAEEFKGEMGKILNRVCITRRLKQTLNQ